MTRSGRCYTHDELALGGQKKDQAKRPISAEDFWRRMQPKDYSIVKHLENTPAQISVWALLMSSQFHRQASMKDHDDTYVPTGTSCDNVAAMIHQVIRGHQISFCDDELPVEGRSNNKTLHIAVAAHPYGWGRPLYSPSDDEARWKNKELVIHGEGSHLGRQVPIIARGTVFYTVELVNATGEYLAPQTPIPACLVWEEIPKELLSLFQFLLKDPDMVWDLREGICDLFEEIDVVVEEKVELDGIRDAEPGELANVVPVAKKDGKIRICVDYRDLNKASPKDNFSLPNIYILIDNCARHEMKSFADCYAGYHHILMDEEDAENMTFITPWGVYNYRVMSFYTYMRNRAFGCILGQHDETRIKERAIYCISKKFTPYESRYTLLERTCCALTWLHQKLRHYLSSYTKYLISRMHPLKYIFQKAMPIEKLAKWQILLSEFDIVHMTQKTIKAQPLADHLAENPVDEEYEPLKTYFHDEEVSFVGEDISEEYPGWRLFFDGAANHQDLGLLRYSNAVEAVKLIEQIHAGVCGTHMNGITLARKTLRAGYFWMTMENDCCKFVQKCNKCQVHGDLIKVPPHELNSMSSPCPFVAWGMDVIGMIEPSISNGHRFILVAIDYFTKWVEAASYKSVTKKVVDDFFATI
ncbi:uncharacterized protein [Solanum lycopersicum]|uniref:uncharacterized protein n=1 Tax=Solanum lycopersicum TaxID=4081 RepID=UPI00374919D2